MAYNTINSTRLELLSKSNYDTWKIQVEALLIKNDTWGYVSGEKPKPTISTDATMREESLATYNAWITGDRKAKSDLILSMNPSELKQIKDCETSKNVWDKLESIYASKGPARKATLLKSLMLRKMSDDGDVKDHLNDLFDAVDKLQSMNVEINGDMLAIIILYSLPESYDTFRCAIESRDDLPDVETLKIKIFEESEARKRKTPDNGAGALLIKHQNQQPHASNNKTGKNNKNSFSSNKRIKCNYCKKIGHKAANCYAKRNSEQNAGHATETVLLTTNPAKSKEWCLDSGCTSHLCNNKEFFVEITNVSSGLKLANNDTTKVEAKGDVRITALVNKKEKSLRLTNTLYVPNLRTNLLSVAKIVDNNHEITFKQDRAIVRNLQGKTTMIAKRVNDLYYLQEKPEQACITSEHERSHAQTWHERLGHLNMKDVRLMWRNQSVAGMKLEADSIPIDCKICAAGKLSSTPFSSRGRRSSGALDLVHTDICGPMRTESQGGARYFVTFIDDYTRWCEIYFMRNKSDVTEKFKEFMKFAERYTGRKIKAIQSDNGKEYCNRVMDALFKEHGIRHRLTVPHTPQQNGIAERKNRTLVETARCMIIQSGLPPSFWAEAISSANYIRNRCITKGLESGTPFEKWTGRRPNIAHLRTFGCRAFILNKSPSKGKFDIRGLEGTFVGYSETSKAYRIWCPKDQKIHVSRDVKFFHEYDTKNPTEDIVTHETTNGHFRIMDDLEVNNDSRETHIETNESESTEDHQRIEEIDGDEKQVESLKRGRGRPRGSTTRRSVTPTKQYNLRSNDQKKTSIPETIEVSSNEDIGPHESMFAFLASEIPLSQAISGPDAAEWKDAIYDEVRSLVTNDTWELVERPGDANIVGCRIVLRNKYDADGRLDKRKARIVAKGFSQRPGIDFHDTFAPVARLSSLRLLIALSAEYKMSISQLDIASAYLHGNMDVDVYMEAPELLDEMLTRISKDESAKKLRHKAGNMLTHFRQGRRVCLLRKALYGLRQAGRQWHSKLKESLEDIGLTSTNADPCVYTNLDKTTFLLVYVDDILIATSDHKSKQRVINALTEKFAVKDLGEAKYCLGIEIIRNKEKIFLSQAGYIQNLLNRFGMTNCKKASTPLSSGFKPTPEDRENKDNTAPYRELVGGLMYLAMATRPDIAHAVSVLSQFNNHHSGRVWTEAKHVLRYLKDTSNLALCFRPTKAGLLGFVDADWGNCTIDRRSYTGMVFILAGAAISWESHKQRTVALSSTEAEYMALTDAAKEAIYLIGFLKELGLVVLTNVTIFNDNQGAGELARNPVFHGRSKHIDVRHHFIREAINNYTIKLEYTPTDQMIADVLTKTLGAGNHRSCIHGMGVMNVDQERHSN